MRNRFKAAGFGLAVALACALPAHADNWTAKDSAAATQTFAAKLWSGVLHPFHMIEVMVGGAPAAVTGDGTGAGLDVHVRDSALPAGGATAVNQAANGAKLDTLHTDVTAGTTQAATNGGKLDTLHTDVATTVHGDLTTANGTLSQIQTNTAAGATAAGQTTASGKLDTLHTDLTGGGQKAQIASNAPNLSATGTLTVLNDAVSITPAGLAGLGVEVTGTNAGGVITPECEVSGVWQAINIIPLGGGAKASTITAAGSWESIAGGVAQCRLRLSTAGSGSFGVTLVATNGSRLVRAFNTDPTNFYATVSDGQNAANTNTLPCTLNSTTTICGPYTPTAQNYHISWAPSAFTANCQLERKTDGTNFAIVTVTAGGSTTQMNNWSFSASSQAITEDLSQPQQGVQEQIHCTTTPSGSAAVKFSQ